MKLLTRHDGTTAEETKPRLWRRMRLRRADGSIYLDRWGLAHDRIGGILLHRMQAPDPGVDLHDHPWWFASIVLWGGYTEHRSDTRGAPQLADMADRYADLGKLTRGWEVDRPAGSIRTLRLDECHTIFRLHRRTSWTLVIRGPRRRGWGFYLPEGYMDERSYDETVRAGRRDLWNEVGS